MLQAASVAVRYMEKNYTPDWIFFYFSVQKTTIDKCYAVQKGRSSTFLWFGKCEMYGREQDVMRVEQDVGE